MKEQLTDEEEFAVAIKIAKSMDLELERSWLGNENCLKVTYIYGNLLRSKTVYIFFKPVSMPGTMFATRDLSEIIAVYDSLGVKLDPDLDMIMVIADLDAGIRTEIDRLTTGSRVAKIKEYLVETGQSNDFLGSKDLHWNTLRNRAMTWGILHIWYADEKGKNDIYGKITNIGTATQPSYKAELLLTKYNSIKCKPSKENIMIFNQLHDLLAKSTTKVITENAVEKSFAPITTKNFIEVGFTFSIDFENKSPKQIAEVISRLERELNEEILNMNPSRKFVVSHLKKEDTPGHKQCYEILTKLMGKNCYSPIDFVKDRSILLELDKRIRERYSIPKKQAPSEKIFFYKAGNEPGVQTSLTTLVMVYGFKDWLELSRKNRNMCYSVFGSPADDFVKWVKKSETATNPTSKKWLKAVDKLLKA